MASTLTIDLQRAIVYPYRRGNWYAIISCAGQHSSHVLTTTSTIQGMESSSDKGATELVWNENKQLHVQFPETHEISIHVYWNQECLCSAMVPLKEENQELECYALKASPYRTCGSVMLKYSWSRGPQIRSKHPDRTFTPGTYFSGNPLWPGPMEHQAASNNHSMMQPNDPNHPPPVSDHLQQQQQHILQPHPNTPQQSTHHMQYGGNQHGGQGWIPTGGNQHGRGQPPGGGIQDGRGYPPGGGNQHGRGDPPGGGNQHGGGYPPGGGNQHGGGYPPGGGNQHGRGYAPGGGNHYGGW